MARIKINKEEPCAWQVRQDAQTLEDALVIKKDKKRYKDAIEFAHQKRKQYGEVISDSIEEKLEGEDK